jgi:DNA polymerase-3 subunit alpha (Gram-positive type)
MLREFSYLGKSRAVELVVRTPPQQPSASRNVEPHSVEPFPPSIEGSDEDLQASAGTTRSRVYGDRRQSCPIALERELDFLH